MLHKTIDHLILDNNVTKSDFASHLGVARSTLNGYLSGKNPIPSDKIEKIAAYFKVPISRLFGEKEKENTQAIQKIINQQNKRIEKLEQQINLIANSLQMKKQ